MYRATGRGLSFITVDDIVTMPGFPREQSIRHCEALLMFYYRPDCQLCRVVRTFSASDRRRRRRQAESTDNKLVVTSDIVHAVLNEQAYDLASLFDVRCRVPICVAFLLVSVYYFLANVNSRSRSLYAVARPSVVCL